MCVYLCVRALSRVSLSMTPWTVAHQAPLSMVFSRQEYWSALPFPPPGDLPDPGIEPPSPASPALSGRYFTIRGKPFFLHTQSEIKQISMPLRNYHAAATAKSLQSCLTLWDPMDRNPPGSPIPGILQARTPQWVGISFSNE